jgi:alkanesulfonate monooxygenase SsuD/methylene tetrahydromethanopterin reductase-like flavin-dependent oxidoreductase (luciferase family)
MRIGYSLPFSHEDKSCYSPQEIMSLARSLEAAGFASVWLGDVVGRGHYNNGRPYPPRPDPLQWLLLAAAATERLEVGTAVLQVPVRAPVDLAQRLLTLHALSKGRFTAGVGTGSSRPDFAAAGVDYDKRFTILRSNLDLMRRLWRGEQVGEANLRPWTDSVGGPPIVIGAWVSPLWIRRAAQDYDGWLVSSGNVGGFTNTFGTLKEALKRFRDFGGKRAIVGAGNPDFSHPSVRMTDDAPFNLRCGPEEARERIARMADAGFDDVILRNDNLAQKDIDIVAEGLGLKYSGATR